MGTRVMNGTTLDTHVVRVVDGDTLRVRIGEHEESLRLLSLDTEETSRTSTKPVTPLGRAATAEAKKFWSPEDPVRLEFPGSEPLETCLNKHRGNFNRLLVWAYRQDGTDFQEHMIRQGLSPYFVKYGYARYTDNHLRYVDAERDAQIRSRGIWDQVKGNGSEINNYAALITWWTLRAEIIENYRTHMATNPIIPVLNTRLDYDQLVTSASQENENTIFTDLRSIRRVGGHHVAISIGALARPFDIFIPDAYGSKGQAVVDLLTQRYVPSDLEHPRRGYAYLRGPLSMYRDTPQIVIRSVAQISDSPFTD